MRCRSHDAERGAEQKCDDAGAQRRRQRPAETDEQRREPRVAPIGRYLKKYLPVPVVVQFMPSPAAAVPGTAGPKSVRTITKTGSRSSPLFPTPQRCGYL